MARPSKLPEVQAFLKGAKKKGATVKQTSEALTVSEKTAFLHLTSLCERGVAKLGTYLHRGCVGRPPAVYYATEFAPQGDP